MLVDVDGIVVESGFIVDSILISFARYTSVVEIVVDCVDD